MILDSDDDAVRVEFPSGNWFADLERDVAAEVIVLWNAQADDNQRMIITDRSDVELALRIAHLSSFGGQSG